MENIMEAIITNSSSKKAGFFSNMASKLFTCWRVMTSRSFIFFEIHTNKEKQITGSKMNFHHLTPHTAARIMISTAKELDYYESFLQEVKRLRNESCD